MPTIQQNTLDWAKSAMVDYIEELLDDPAGFLTAQADDFPTFFVKLRGVVKDLGLDYDVLVNQSRNSFQKDRLASFENGTWDK